MAKPRNKKSDEADQPAALEVRMSRAAEAAYEKYYERAEQARQRGEHTSYHITALNMIDDVIENVIPRDPFNKKYALSGELSRIFRAKKGRLRICWVGSSSARVVYVIFISETLRKDGDVNDPYSILTGLVLSGKYDHVFEQLGLRKPSSIKPQSFRTQ